MLGSFLKGMMELNVAIGRHIVQESISQSWDLQICHFLHHRQQYGHLGPRRRRHAPTLSASNPIDELESFRSTWRQEIQKGKPTQSPPRQRTQSAVAKTSPVAPSSPRRSEDDSVTSTRTETVGKSPLEVYEGAILKERQGILSEAVMQYRRAFKVPVPTSRIISEYIDGSRRRQTVQAKVLPPQRYRSHSPSPASQRRPPFGVLNPRIRPLHHPPPRPPLRPNQRTQHPHLPHHRT